MSFARIEKVGDSAALFLTDDMLNLMGIGLGDEVEVSITENKLIVRSPYEQEERQRFIEKTTASVLKRRANLYKRLAEGVSEKKLRSFSANLFGKRFL